MTDNPQADPLTAAVERVRRLHDSLNAETDLTSPDDEITRGAAARKIAAALDGYTPPAAPAARAAILREAADIAESLRQFEPATGARKSAQVSENVGILRVADELRRMADEAQQPETQAHRGDVFEQWLKAQRDASADYPEAYQAADGLLDLYRLHADTGTPLGEHVCEARVVGDCDCLEQPAAVSQPGKEA